LDKTEEEIMHQRGVNVTGIRGSRHGDDTASRGQALAADDLEHNRKWIAVVEEIEKAIPQHLQVFLRLRRDYRYRKGPNGWMPIVQHRFAVEMAQLTRNQEENTYRSASRLSDYWDEIVNYTVRKAIAEGLFSKGRENR
jgi:hypothetical protein